MCTRNVGFRFYGIEGYGCDSCYNKGYRLCSCILQNDKLCHEKQIIMLGLCLKQL
jgi:hypothetical protein